MKINIKVIKGKTFVAEIDSKQTVDELKRLVMETDGVDIELQKLVYKGKSLTNNMTLEEAGVKDGVTIVVMKKKVN